LLLFLNINFIDRANFFRDSNIVVTNGFCMPASCSVTKSLQFLNQQVLAKNDLVALGGECRDINDIDLEPLDYFAM
jgi:hypothetical protein